MTARALARGGALAAGLAAMIVAAPAAAQEPITARGAPHSFQVVAVPAPAGAAGGYRVTPVEGARLIGPLAGEIADGRVTFTIGIPSDAPAGRRSAARVDFDGGRSVDVAVEVTPVSGADLRLDRALFAVVPGGRAAVDYTVTNTGNAPAAYELRVASRAVWRPAWRPVVHALAPGRSASGRIELRVPLEAEAGSGNMELLVLEAGEQRAAAPFVIEVVPPETWTAAEGPVLRAGFAALVGGSSPVTDIEIAGPVGEGARLRARWSSAEIASLETRGLGRVGGWTGEPFVAWTGRRLTWTAGSVETGFSDVTGTGVWGRGGSFAWNDARWSGAGFAGRSAEDGGGELRGARLGVRVDETWIQATATDLSDERFGGRSLRALGVGAISPELSGTRLSGELAGRWWGAGAAPGWSAELSRRGEEDLATVRWVHAPGGSAAFARAADEVTASASRRLGPVSLAGTGWVARDESPLFAFLGSSGWSATGRLALARAELDLELRGYGFDARGSEGSFGSDEAEITLGAALRGQRFHAATRATFGESVRRAETAAGITPPLRAPRHTWTGAAGLQGGRGAFEITALLEHAGRGGGRLPRYAVTGFRASRIRPLVWPLLLDAELARHTWFGDRAAETVVRLGAEVPLPAGLKLRVSGERDPLVSGTGGSGWTTAVRIERSTTLPVPWSRNGSGGTVFLDLNADGERDAGEPGLEGVLVRRGIESAVTDFRGRYRFDRSRRAPVAVDEGSLRFGLVATRSPGGDAADLAVVPMSPVVVHLVPRADEHGRTPDLAGRAVTVVVRDRAGRSWSAQSDARGVAVFAALPPGDYEVLVESGVDFRTEPASLVVPASGAAPPLEIPVGPRRLRFRTPPADLTRGGGQ